MQQKIELTLEEATLIRALLAWAMTGNTGKHDEQRFKDAFDMLRSKIPVTTIDHDTPQPPKPAPEILPYQVIARRADGTSVQWQFIQRPEAIKHYNLLCCGDNAVVWMVEQTRITQIWQAKKSGDYGQQK